MKICKSVINKKTVIFLLISAALLMLMAGCADIQRFFAPEYTVVYYSQGERAELTVKENEVPVNPTAHEASGLRFVYWADAAGAETDPETVAVMADTEYFAVYLPTLEQHASYLFSGEKGFIRPDDALTGNEFSAAINALGSDAAKEYYPELPESDEEISGKQIMDVLKCFYTEDVLGVVPNDLAEKNSISRAQFAGVMNTVLGRDAGENVTAAEAARAIPDLPGSRADYAAVCEAAIDHEHGNGSAWADVRLAPLYAEGFLPMDGCLYYVNADGTFLYDADVGTLHFGADGLYTSGDETLDGLVRAVLAEIYAANPEADRFEMMKTAYYYCRDTFQYLRRNYYDMGETGWDVQEATTMLDTNRGNCYNYAAAFCHLSRGLGYEARTVSGTITVTRQPHGWVIMTIDGEEYFFDPEMEMTYIRDRRPVKNMFMMERSYAAGWTYRGA